MDLISRVVAGWNVRMVISGKRRSRFFADGRFGGKSPALRAAKAYRETLIAQRRPRTLTPRPLRVLRGGSACFQIRVCKPGGGTTTTEFSITRHGSRQARQLALKAFANAHRRASRSAISA